ncbi:M3 family oligoendopeptidase [bacterium]|nr:M3 family oligoendopeptidase [bacterium]
MSSFEKRERVLLPANFELTSFESIEPFLKKLLDTEITSETELEQWIKENSEIDAFLNEDLAWRYINYTRFTNNKEFADAYSYFVKEIQPKLVKSEHELNKKVVESAYFDDLPDFPLINFKRKSRLSLSLFREENIALEVEQTNLGQEYAAIVGAMAVHYNNKELTMQQASTLLREPDRLLRKEIYEAINTRRLEDKNRLDEIFDQLVQLRHQQALNCGFENFRDYKHEALGRFDYAVKDVFEFHNAVAKVAVPIQNRLLEHRKEKMAIEQLYPYDVNVNIYDRQPLKPFETEAELVDKAIKCFTKIDPFFGLTLATMRDKGFLDLESRKGKAPGGYNYPLDEHGIPFIFMNASGSMRDVTTIVHEGGHAIHSLLTRNIDVNALKHCPSEVAELASMSMELISMDGWDEFFDNPKDLLRAKIEQLESILDVLPWIATVDKFQHWIYTNPAHNSQQRDDEWEKIYNTFSSRLISFDGYESYKRNLWQKQLHIFEVPFYYIEYGIAQLGAIAIWKNYKENPEKALENYKAALSLGYTKTIPEIYETAGVHFNFSEAYVAELLNFIWAELDLLIHEFTQLENDVTA